jgi:hypothetical protein
MRTVFRIGYLAATATLVAASAIDLHGAAWFQRPARAETAPAAPDDAASPVEIRAVLDKYCVTCHNERLKSASIVLEQKDVGHVASDVETWERVVRKLEAGAMPPMGVPRPDAGTLKRVWHGIAAQLDREAAQHPNPGRLPIHRLNRLEYTNAIRDLLGLEIDGKTLLPADDTGFGFDNIADVLTVSPGLFERYMLAATKISRLAVEDPALLPQLKSYELPYLSLAQDDRVSEDLPFGSRGGIAVRHYFPLDGEYELRITLHKSDLTASDHVRGLSDPTQIDIRLDRERMKLISIGGGKRQVAYGYGTEPDYPEDGFVVRFAAKSGLHVIGVTLNQDRWKPEGVGVGSLPLTNAGTPLGINSSLQYGRVQATIEKVNVTGPYEAIPPASSLVHRKIFICEPASAASESACATTILARLARVAYRRPVTPDDMQTLMAFYQDGKQADGTFRAGVQTAIGRMLVDPKFLFRLEREPASLKPDQLYQVSDLDLASRLSFFLWSSIPDDQLLTLAEKGQLRNAGVLQQQVRRMLQDPRSDAFLESFFGQWLLTRNVVSQHPDPRVFPEFDESLRRAFLEETRLFLQDQVRTDRPAIELLTANYTFVNERLAQHYGIPGVVGGQFRRVTLSDPARAGLLGQGSILTVTAYNDRTSVVVRGKFILDTILGTPPPPPPADVPPLANTKIEGSLRQRMELHRKNPVCASCHRNIDPLGFALENFDGVGHYRTMDANAPVDASGSLPDGSTFDGPARFRQLLVDRQDAFLTVLTTKLLTYGMGRGVELFDMPAVRKIIQDARASDDNWSALILGVVQSMPFQMRRAQDDHHKEAP